LLIAVTSNADDGSEGTLRWAIQQTQNTEGDDQKFDIVFSEMPDQGNTTELKTGAWTIPLKTVLPNIYKNDIRINYLKPKNITIHPAEFKVESDTAKGLSPYPMMTLDHGSKWVGEKHRPESYRQPIDRYTEGFNGTSPSMLVVGDGHLVHQHLNKGVVNHSPNDPATNRGIPLPFKVSGTKPTLAVNKINFVGNETRGGNGTRQAGGGGAMGGQSYS
jgi:hypothetical protein